MSATHVFVRVRGWYPDWSEALLSMQVIVFRSLLVYENTSWKPSSTRMPMYSLPTVLVICVC